MTKQISNILRFSHFSTGFLIISLMIYKPQAKKYLMWKKIMNIRMLYIFTFKHPLHLHG